MAAVVGYSATLYKGGTPTSMTNEPLSQVSGAVYRITDTAKRLIDPATAITIKDHNPNIAGDGTGTALTLATDVDDVDCLFGKVTLDAGYSVVGELSISGNYIPLTFVADVRAFTADLTRTILDSTVVQSTPAANRNRIVGLKDASGTIELLDDATELISVFESGNPLYLVFRPTDSLTVNHLRVRVKIDTNSLAAGVDDLVTNTYNWACDGVISADGYDVSVGFTV